MHEIGHDKSTPTARWGRRARSLTEAAQPPKAEDCLLGQVEHLGRIVVLALGASVIAACDQSTPLGVNSVPQPLAEAPQALVNPVG